jgi:hypothetical protein
MVTLAALPTVKQLLRFYFSALGKFCGTDYPVGIRLGRGLRWHRQECLCYLEGNSGRATMLRQTLDRLS